MINLSDFLSFLLSEIFDKTTLNDKFAVWNDQYTVWKDEFIVLCYFWV